MLMHVTNIHQREYNQPRIAISEILLTLSSKEDRLWPKETWPPMILHDGLKVNSCGGHGPIGYYISSYDHGRSIEFTFTEPEDFIGIHRFDILETSQNSTILRHTIDMRLTFKGLFSWYLAIKWLHDALLEDCLDNVHNQLHTNKKQSPHNFWVRILRNILKRKR